MRFFKYVIVAILGTVFMYGHVSEIDMGKSYKVSTLVGSSVQSNYYRPYYYKRHHVKKKRHYTKKHYTKRYVKPTLYSDSYRYKAKSKTNEMWMQISLSALGFYNGKIDGSINSFETRSAIKKMNNSYGISGDIYLSPKRRDALIYLGKLFDFDKTLIANQGSRSSRNKKIQTALKINGFYFGDIDGSMGRMTKRAIYEYKSSLGLARSSYLNYEDEYRLVHDASIANSKDIEDTLALLKSSN